MNTETIALWTLRTQIALLGIQIPTLIMLVIYVIQTWRMADATRLAAHSAQNTLLEMQATRDQETAPYIVVYFDVPNDTRAIELVIKNTGESMATNVKAVFDPPIILKAPFQDMLSRVLSPEGIPSIPPDYEIRTSIAMFPDYKKSGLPMTFTVDVTYQGGIREEKRNARYNLDLTLYSGIMQSVLSVPTIKDVVNELSHLRLTQERIGEKFQQISHVNRPQRKFRKV